MLLTFLLAGFSAYAADHIEFGGGVGQAVGTTRPWRAERMQRGTGNVESRDLELPAYHALGIDFYRLRSGTEPVPAARLDGHNVARDRRQSAGGNNQGTVPN